MAAMRRRVHAGTPWPAHRPRLNRPDAATRKPLIAERTGAPVRPGVRRLRCAGYAIAPGYTTDPIEKAVFVGFC